MTQSAGGKCNRPGASRRGELSLQLTGSDVMSLAINLVQNGLDHRELRPGLACFVGSSVTEPQARGESGDAPVPAATRLMLEDVYREILRANAQHVGPNGSLPPAQFVGRFLFRLRPPTTGWA